MGLMGRGTHMTLEQLQGLSCPSATPTWRPISHHDLATTLRQGILDRGHTITKEDYLIADKKPGSTNRLFGVFVLEQDPTGERFKMIGFRQALDKSMGVWLSGGFQVTVCSNMVFGGEYILKHKHSVNFNLRSHIDTVLGTMDTRWNALGTRVEQLKQEALDLPQAKELVVNTAEAGAIASCDILPILEEYQKPSFQSFAPGFKWALYNAYTFIGQKWPVAKLDNCLRTLSEERFFNMGQTEVAAEAV